MLNWHGKPWYEIQIHNKTTKWSSTWLIYFNQRVEINEPDRLVSSRIRKYVPRSPDKISHKFDYTPNLKKKFCMDFHGWCSRPSSLLRSLFWPFSVLITIDNNQQADVHTQTINSVNDNNHHRHLLMDVIVSHTRIRMQTHFFLLNLPAVSQVGNVNAVNLNRIESSRYSAQ